MKVPEHILELAKTQARKSVMTYRHGAVLIDARGVVLNTGYNHPVYMPSYENKREHCIHSEQSALTGLRHDKIRGAIMIVIRINRNSELLMSRPCIRCQKLLSRKGIAKVLFSSENGELETMRL